MRGVPRVTPHGNEYWEKKNCSEVREERITEIRQNNYSDSKSNSNHPPQGGKKINNNGKKNCKITKNTSPNHIVRYKIITKRYLRRRRHPDRHQRIIKQKFISSIKSITGGIPAAQAIGVARQKFLNELIERCKINEGKHTNNQKSHK